MELMGNENSSGLPIKSISCKKWWMGTSSHLHGKDEHTCPSFILNQRVKHVMAKNL